MSDTSSSDLQQKVLFSILEYLSSLKDGGKLDVEGLGVAIEVLQAASGLSLGSDADKAKYSTAPHSLPQIFSNGLAHPIQSTENKEGSDEIKDPELREKFAKYLDLLKKRSYLDGCDVGSAEYNERVAKARVRFLAKYQAEQQQQQPAAAAAAAAPAAAAAAPAPVDKYAGLTDAERLATAEALKNDGNKMLTSRQYDEAIRLYTEAISLNANNAIFFSNRAAAYSHLGKHAQAIEDCNKALSIDINYAKAYSRLGLAHFSTGNYQQAVAAYKRAVELEPGNALAQESLQAAQARLEEENAPKPAAPTPAAGGFDPAMMANMANMFGGAGAGGAPGGMGGLGALLNNPQFMNMAQGLMQDPQFMNMAQNMMKNPDALKNIGKMFGQGGPDAGNDDDDNAPAV